MPEPHIIHLRAGIVSRILMQIPVRLIQAPTMKRAMATVTLHRVLTRMKAARIPTKISLPSSYMISIRMYSGSKQTLIMKAKCNPRTEEDRALIAIPKPE